MREGMSPAAATGGSAGESAAPANGSHDAPAALAPVESPPPERAREVPPPQPREYHSEPRESGAAHEAPPVAHFEPGPKPDAAAQGKPYVVWSSAPSGDAGSRGSEE
jgi:hypothetical protein